jgi:MFS family permease
VSRRRDLALVSLGSGVSWFGNSLAVIALLLTLRGAGSFAIAGLFIAEMVPLFLIATVAGLVVDRLPNRRLMIVAELGQGLATVGLACWQPNLAAVFGFVILLSVGTALVRPAASALIPVITGEEGATRGYSLMATASSAGILLGTAAGGVLVTAFGPRTALLIDATTFIVEALALLWVRAERRAKALPEQGTALGEITAGLRLLFGDRVLITAVGGVAVSCFTVNLLTVAEVFFVMVTLRSTGIVLGVIQAMWMAGVLIGALIGARFHTVRAIALLLAICECGMGFALSWPAVFPLTVVTAAAYLVAGTANGAQSVAQTALVRLRSPQEMRGRIFAGVNGLISGANLLANLVGGVIVAEVGPRLTFAVAAPLTLVAGLGVLVLSARLTAGGRITDAAPAAAEQLLG